MRITRHPDDSTLVSYAAGSLPDAFAAVVAAHAWAAEEVFVLPGGGALVLTVPAGWKHEKEAGSTTISLTPRAGRGFQVQVTPLVRPDGTPTSNILETLPATARVVGSGPGTLHGHTGRAK